MKKIGIWIFLLIFVVYALIPLFVVLLTTVKNEKEMFENVLGLPRVLRLTNYSSVWIDKGFYRYFFNSVLITIPTMVLVMICSSLAGFAFSKMHFKGRYFLFFVFLIGLMVPVPSLSNGAPKFVVQPG